MEQTSQQRKSCYALLQDLDGLRCVDAEEPTLHRLRPAHGNVRHDQRGAAFQERGTHTAHLPFLAL